MSYAYYASTVAGTGSSGTANGAGRTYLSQGTSVATFAGIISLASKGTTIYVVSSTSIRQVVPNGYSYTVSTITTGLTSPKGMCVDSNNTIYVLDNYCIKRLVWSSTSSTYGAATVFAGSLNSPGTTDATGATARFNGPSCIVCGYLNTMFVTDGTCLRQVTTGAVVTTIAGSPTTAGNTTTTQTGPNARFTNPAGMCLDTTDKPFSSSPGGGNLFLLDNQYLYKLYYDNAMKVQCVVNNNTNLASNAANGNQIAYLGGGRIMIANHNKHSISTWTRSGTFTITSVGFSGSSGITDGLNTAARFSSPSAMCADSAGNLYVGSQNYLRKVFCFTPQTTLTAPTFSITTSKLYNSVYYVASSTVAFTAGKTGTNAGIQSYSINGLVATSSVFNGTSASLSSLPKDTNGSTYSVTGVTAGLRTNVYLTLKDFNGISTSSSALSIYVQTSPSIISLTSITNANLFSSIYYVSSTTITMTLNVSTIYSPITSYKYLYNGSTYSTTNLSPVRTTNGSQSFTFTGLTSGSNAFKIYFIDVAGYSSNTVSCTIYVDTTTPKFAVSNVNTLSAMTNGKYYIPSSSITMNISSTYLSSILSYTYSYTGPTSSGNTTVTSTNPTSIPLTLSTTGLYTVYLSVKNAANTSSTTSTTYIYVETLSPATSLVSISGTTFSSGIYTAPVSKAYIILNLTSVYSPGYFYYSVSGPIGVTTVSNAQVNGILYSISGFYTFSIPLSKVGTYTYSVFFKDYSTKRSNDLGPYTIYVVSEIPTLLCSVSGANYTNGIYYTTSSGALIRLTGVASAYTLSEYNYTQTNPDTSTYTFNGAYISERTYQMYAPVDGTYTVSVSLIDTSGTQGIDTISVVVETTPPTIDSLYVADVNKDTAGIYYTNNSEPIITISGLSTIAESYFTTYAYRQVGPTGVVQQNSSINYNVLSSQPFSIIPDIDGNSNPIDGPYNLTLTFTDVAGLSVSSSVVVFIEQTQPTIQGLYIQGAPIDSEGVNYTTTSGAILTISGLTTKSSFLTYSYSQTDPFGFTSVSDGSYVNGMTTYPIHLLGDDGLYAITMVFADIAGLSVTYSVNVFLETVYPTLDAITVADAPQDPTTGIYYVDNSGITLTLSGLLYESNIVSYTYVQTNPDTTKTYDASSDVYTNTSTFPIQLSTNGSYAITMTFTDFVGYSVSSSLVVVLQTQPVSIGSIYIADAQQDAEGIFYTNTSGVLISISGLYTESIFTSYSYTLTYSDTTQTTDTMYGVYTNASLLPMNLSGGDGSYTIEIVFTDILGYSVESFIQVFLETAPLPQPNLSISGGYLSNNIYYTNTSGVLINVSGLSTPSAFSQYSYTQTHTDTFRVSNPLLPIPAYTLSIPRPGTYTVYATFYDSFGSPIQTTPITIQRV